MGEMISRMLKCTVDFEAILLSLGELGVKQGDILLVYSSLSSFGYVHGGANTVIDALLKAVGQEGTVLVPTLTGKSTDGPQNPPIFDVKETPCWTGKIPATFMKLPQAKRSLHPTHSVSSIGPLTEFLIKNHENSMTPCGEESPYYRLAEKGGYILLIGVDQESNTTIHTAEELAEVPYHMQKEPTECTIIDYKYKGNRFTRRLYLHKWGTSRQFQKIDDKLEKLGFMRKVKCGNSTLRLINSMQMIDWLVSILRKEPWYLCLHS